MADEKNGIRPTKARKEAETAAEETARKIREEEELAQARLRAEDEEAAMKSKAEDEEADSKAKAAEDEAAAKRALYQIVEHIGGR